jgi:hypothetical protein
MKHFTCFAASSANFESIYETGLKNILRQKTEPVAKKYIRKKKEQAEATSSDEKEG